MCEDQGKNKGEGMGQGYGQHQVQGQGEGPNWFHLYDQGQVDDEVQINGQV